MSAPRALFIHDILVEHVEELEFLWAQRCARLNSSVHTLRDVAELNERIEAHVQGLLLARSMLPELLAPELLEPRRSNAFAAAFPLLRLREPRAAAQVTAAFAEAGGAALAGLRDALATAPVDLTVIALREQFAAGTAPRAAAAAAALAAHKAMDPLAPRLQALLDDADAGVRAQAWAVVARVDPPGRAPPRPWESALRGDDAQVRAAALEAAAWTGQPWLPQVCRRLALAAPAAQREAARLFAVLAGPQARDEILRLAAQPALGADGPALLGAYGHPAAVELLIAAMAVPDPRLAAAAGAAFTKLTGVDVRGERRARCTDHDPDDAFAAEFADEVTLPDGGRARAVWARDAERLRGGTRWCRGFDLSAGCDADTLRRLDLESRWEACRRAAVAGRPLAPPPPL